MKTRGVLACTGALSGAQQFDKEARLLYHVIMNKNAPMFKTGDKIAYPMHGAGVIEAVEEKPFLNENRNYYILRFSEGDIKVHVPVETAHKSGLRRIITSDECCRVIESFKTPGDDDETVNWNRRNRENLEKMKSGNVFEIAAVIKSLLKREEKKSLSSSEKKMLGTSMQILVSELALASDRRDEEVRSAIIRMC